MGKKTEGLLKMLARFSKNEEVTILEKKNAGGLTEDDDQIGVICLEKKTPRPY